ncbi:MAG: NAD(P)-dependent oxidoreductase [Bacillota bacterium]|nr:NAD(P)-dependent oxidoreductase [Bacillota bacterium]
MNLLLTGAFQYTEEQLNKLRSLCENVTFVQDERQKLDIDVSSFDAVVCNGLFQTNDIHDFKNLKYIQLTSAGLDRVPLDYIREHNIKLNNARGVYSIPMAEWALLKALEIYKCSKSFYESQSNKKWNKVRNIQELYNKTVCVVGVGSIGHEVCKRFSAFGCRIIGVDIVSVADEFVDEFFLINEINSALQKSDVVVLTLPLTNDTKHLFNKELFSQMKHGSVLINIARGGVICQEDLIEAIQGGRFCGVALDVFEEEPLSESSSLWDMKNVIVTPHNSFVSEGNNERLFDVIIQGLEKECCS